MPSAASSCASATSSTALVDGVINNYMACRAIFDVKQGAPNRNPWAAKRCPNNADPNPQDTSAAACLTDGQIATLKMVYSPYVFATPLANGVKSLRHVVPEYGSLRQRPDRQCALSADRRARPKMRRCTAISAFWA